MSSNISNLAACCLQLQNLPENPGASAITLSPVASDSNDFNQAVQLVFRKPSISTPLVFSATLSATGQIVIDLTDQTNGDVIALTTYLSRYGGKYTIEVLRTDTNARVSFKENATATESFPGFCFYCYACQIQTPAAYTVNGYSEACSNSCSAC